MRPRPVSLYLLGALRPPTAGFEMTTRTLIVFATALLGAVALHAQTNPAGAGSRQRVPAVAYDREAVLRDIGIAHGMLRGLQYADATTTAQFQATGTHYLAGQAFKPGGPFKGGPKQTGANRKGPRPR